MGLGSFPKRLTKVGNHLYFVTEIAGNNPETILWKSDGTSMGTIPLKTFSAALNLNTQLVAMGDTVFLNIDDGVHGHELPSSPEWSSFSALFSK